MESKLGGLKGYVLTRDFINTVYLTSWGQNKIKMNEENWQK